MKSRLAKMVSINVNNRTIFCKDNIEILKGINNKCIDLVYADPPFNKKKVFIAPFTKSKSSAKGASFKDIFTKEDIKDSWVQTIKEDNDELSGFLEGVKKMGGGEFL